MTALVLRGLAARKLRVALTGIAIVLGVALMAGTYILTDTINHSFAGIFQTANKGHDVVISPTENLGRNTRSQVPPITDEMLARVRATPGVKQAAGSIFATGTLLDSARKRLTKGGAPAFIASESPKPFESFSPVKGRFAAGAEEVAIDEATAKRAGLAIGQQIYVLGSAPAKRYTIVGILKFGGGQSFGGAATAVLTLPEAQRVTGEQGHFDQINVAAAPGVTPAELRDRIRAELPSTVTARTGSEQAAKDSSDLESNLGFLRTFLLVFAYVALFVGAFIIFNTFSITVAQRTREFGLLRTLGASRGQLLRSVVAEGLLLGLAGSAVGLIAGIGLAPALDQLFKAFGAELPDEGTVLQARTIIVSLSVGTIVTLLAGLAPALRATRVPPLAAMREGVEIPRRVLTPRQLIVRSAIVIVALLALRAVVGGGAVIVLIVLVLLRVARLAVRLRRGDRPAPHRITRWLAGAIGELVAWRGITGKLAQENAIRQPGRTLVTAAALTIGIALVTFVAVLAAGTKATINQAVSRSFAGNLIVENSQAGGEKSGIPAVLAPALERVPGVKAVTPVAFTVGRLHGSGSNTTVTAIDPSTFGGVYRIEWKKGSNATLAELDSSGALVSKEFAKSHHLDVGQTFTLQTPTDRNVTLTVKGIVQDNARLLAGVTIPLTLAREAFGQRDDAVDFVAYTPGASNAQVQPAVNRLLAAAFPQAKSLTADQFKEEQAKQINTLLTLIYVLLALSVIVSLFGIVNTLILSIYERTRELGMLRAIGTSRRQIRQMIRYESVITSTLGGVFGLVIGTVGALLTTTFALSESGFVNSVPVGTLIVLLLVSALAGVLAAQLPARRAAKLDVLGALASE
jgi:putative ABC transport system permease protein